MGNLKPEMMQATLNLMGRWMDICGESIYEGRPCDISGTGDDFGLQSKDGKYYFFVFDLPIVGDDNITVAVATV